MKGMKDCHEGQMERFGITSVLNGSALFVAERVERDRENFRLRTPCLTR